MVIRHNTEAVTTATLTGSPLSEVGVTYPEWMTAGVCAQIDPETWFPDKGGSTREAKAMCARCPVAAECLDYALENEERFGIWGGLSERERRKIAKALGLAKERANGNADKTHCVNHHPFTPENTYERPGGGRTCKTCNRQSARLYKQEQS